MSRATPLDVAQWRQRLQQEQSALRRDFDRHADTARLLKAHGQLVDRLLCDLWQATQMPPAISLVAVGGYGRGELFPYSDIDLLILLPAESATTYAALLEPLIGLFWDIGLAVGHSVRTPRECVSEANDDVTVRTNLLEARWLTGNRALFADMRQQCQASLNPPEFLRAKRLEQAQRHARFHDTAYNLEPNVKESPGGLRDLQNVLWISQGLGFGNSWSELARAGLLTRLEARQIRRHELLLQMLRARLHYLAGRREDRLLFDYQNDLAAQLGYQGDARRRASEQLMQRYYRSAKFVRLMNEILLQGLEERASPSLPPAIALNARFSARGKLLETASPEALQRQPGAILESFLLLEQHPELTGMSADLLRNLWRVKTLINRDFRADPAHKTLFLDILRQPVGVTTALRAMNRYGVLGRYIPAFGRISGQMQHDLFHVYTVDEHSLNVLRNLRRFATARYDHEFPLCSRLMQPFVQPELLYLAALFHDIAKGRGGDHSQLGKRDARQFCRAHGLPREDADLVVWLVEKHLLMSSTAQKCDLSDPAVISQFAAEMRTERRLIALYLFTVADIRGTSPAVWNAWKAKLLESLFSATRRLLQGDVRHLDAEVMRRQEEAAVTLGHYAIAAESYRELWAMLGRGYFLRSESAEIAWHTRLLLAHLKTRDPVVRARLSPGGDGIQVLIYTPDREDLFARICAFFERLNYSIVEARIHTTRHGYALDSFLVLDESDRSVSYRDLMRYIEQELTRRIDTTDAPEPPLQGRISRQLKHFPIPPSVTLEADASSKNQQLTVIAGDSPGLLSRISQALLQHGARLHTAKINTLGNRAEDSFLISARDGGHLSDQAAQALREALLSRL